MRTVVWLVGIAVVVAIAMVGFPWVSDLVGQTRGDVNEALANSVRNDTLIQKARNEINNQRNALQGKYAEVLVAGERLSDIGRERDSLQAQLAKHEAALTCGLKLIDDNTGNTIPVNGQPVSRDRVVSDVNRRATHCETLRVRLNAVSRNYDVLAQAVSQGKEAIATSKEALTRAEDELEHKKIVLASGDAIRETDELVGELLGLDVNVDKNRYFVELDKRMAQSQAALEFANIGNGSGEFLDYDSLAAAATPVDSARAYALRHLGQSAPHAPATQPSEPAAGFLELQPEAPAAPAAN